MFSGTRLPSPPHRAEPGHIPKTLQDWINHHDQQKDKFAELGTTPLM
jgi:hypothetical protein